nr:hypothetical protein [Photorhabdus temperata]
MFVTSTDTIAAGIGFTPVSRVNIFNLNACRLGLVLHITALE